jgi:hypothetical protein
MSNARPDLEAGGYGQLNGDADLDDESNLTAGLAGSSA